MYVCVCKAVTDSQIHQEVSKGARRMCDLKQRLGLCSQCGKCGQHAKRVLDEANAQYSTCDTQVVTVAAPA